MATRPPAWRGRFIPEIELLEGRRLLSTSAPVATGDSYAVPRDTGLLLAAPGVLSNDYDLDGDTLQAVLVSGPSHGGLSLKADGSLSYTPNPGFTGLDSFIYQATDGGDASGPATASIQVAKGQELSASGIAFHATEGTGFTGVVATFTEGQLTIPAGNFQATIAWGNGLTSAGTIQGAGNGVFTVSGSTTYTEEGVDAVMVTITGPGQRSAAAPSVAVVADAPLTARGGAALTGSESQTVTGVVAAFTDADPNAKVGDYTANISWGDGRSSPGTIQAGAQGGFTVSGGHTYAEEGNYAVSVRIGDNGGSVASAASAATIADAPLTTAATSLNGVEGQQLSGVVASFSDANPVAPASDFSANINWGDGHTSAGTIGSQSNGQFTVSGGHTYADEGNYAVSVRIGDNGGSIASGYASTATVADAPLTAAGNPINATEGQAFSGGVASFTDANPGAPASDFTANISWGDGHTSAATISSLGNGQFTVSGGHTYAEEGNYAVSVRIGDNGGSVASAASAATVADAPLTAAGTVLNGVERQQLSGVVASFSDAKPAAPLSDFTANITWGDGQQSVGLITADGKGGFLVSGSNTYADEGNYAVSVAISDKGGSSASASSAAAVADAPLTASAASVSAVEGQPLSGAVASFTDANPSAPPSDFSATITWGDGNTAPGTVTADPNGGFDVLGTHTYADEGDYDVGVAITDAGGRAASVAGTVNVADAPLTATGASPLSLVEGQTFSGTVATFTDANPGATDADFSATIDWGDGNVSQGTITADPNGGFDVLGSNTYAEYGTYAIAVAIDDVGGKSATADGTATVIDAPLTATGTTFNATADLEFTGTVVSFVDVNPLGTTDDLTAVINWGDGGTAPGTITDNGQGGYDVTGAYTYAAAGPYTPTVQIVDAGGSSATASGAATVVLEAPTAEDGAYRALHDQTLHVDGPGVLTDASDLYGDQLTAVKVSDPTDGRLALNPDGSFDYTPNPGFVGTDSFLYEAADGSVVSDPAQVTIAVYDHAPAALGDAYSLTHDRPLTVAAAQGVLANDLDADGDTLSAAKVVDPAHGQLTLNSDGSFVYTPDAGFVGTDSFTYKANDGAEDSLPATVVLTVLNQAPVATPITYVLGTDGSVSGPFPGGLLELPGFGGQPEGSLPSGSAPDVVLPAGTAPTILPVVPGGPTVFGGNGGDTVFGSGAEGVLFGARDADGDPLTAQLVGQAAHGTVTLNPDGTFTYVPNPAFLAQVNTYGQGVDSFVYQASDGLALSNPVAISILVEGSAAIVTAPPPNTVQADVTLFSPPGPFASMQGVTAGPDGALWFTETNNDTIGRITTSGVITNEFRLPTSSSPFGIVTGPDGALWFDDSSNNIIFRMTTAGAITEFYLPTPKSGPLDLTVGPDGALWFTEVYTNQIGRITTDGQVTEFPVPGPAGGLMGITAGPDGALWFTDSSTDTIDRITTAGAITAFPIPTPGSYPFGITAGPDGALWFTEENGNKIGRITTAGAITEFALPPPSNPAPFGPPSTDPDSIMPGPDGALWFGQLGGLVGRITTDGAITEFTSLDPTAHGVNALAAGPDGALWFTLNNGQIGRLLPPAANPGPVAAPPSLPSIYREDGTAATGTWLTGFGGWVSPADRFASAVGTASAPTATATWEADGLAPGTYDVSVDWSFDEVIGVDNAPYQIFDGNTPLATVPVNQMAQFSGSADLGDYAIGSGTLRVVLSNNAWSPAVGTGDGIDTGSGFTIPVVVAGTLTVSPVSSAVSVPVPAPPILPSIYLEDGTAATAENTPLTSPVGLFGTGPSGAARTPIVLAQPQHGVLTANPDGSYTYTPAPGFVGVDRITGELTDGTNVSNVATLTITVTPTEFAPQARGDAFAVEQGDSLDLTAPQLLANDSDPDGQPPSVTLLSQPANGTLTEDGQGNYVYTPEAGFLGTDTFAYAAVDAAGNTSNPATVVLTVYQTNQPPVAVADSYTLHFNETLDTDAVTGVLANDTDPENDALTAVLVGGPASAQDFALNPDGTFTYTPTPEFLGTDSFSYKAFDGTSYSDPVTVTIDVTDEAPVATDASFEVHANTPLSTDQPGLLVSAYSPNDDALTAEKVSDPSHGTVVVNPDGSFLYTPVAGYVGDDAFTYQVSDGALTSNAATVTLSVTDEAPVASDATFDVAANESLSAPSVLANSFDLDNDTLTAVLVSRPASAQAFALNPDGTLTYTPAPGFVGTDSFVYQAWDGALLSDSATVTLNVTATPLAANDSYEYSPGRELDVSAADGVLANAFAIGPQPLSATLVQRPVDPSGTAHGALDFHADGSFDYRPDPNYQGPVSFEYEAQEGALTSIVATVVLAPAAPPPPLNLWTVFFTGGTALLSDTSGGTFKGPQWVDNNYDGVIDPTIKDRTGKLAERAWPYSYARGSALNLNAVFPIAWGDRKAFQQAYDNGDLKIQGEFLDPTNGNEPITIKADTLKFNTNKGTQSGDVTINATADAPFKNVGAFALTISWTYSLDGGTTWMPVGKKTNKSTNQIYITYAQPTGTSELYQTAVAYGSAVAKGGNTPEAILQTIWDNFSNQQAMRADGTKLQYYGTWDAPGITLPVLLTTADGRCGAWAELFVAALRAQGLTQFVNLPNANLTNPNLAGNVRRIQVTAPGMGFLVNKWTFAAAGRKVGGFDYSNLVGAPGAFWDNNGVQAANNVPAVQVGTIGKKMVVYFQQGVQGFLWGEAKPDVTDAAGVGGQNSPNPLSAFTDHAVVQIGNLLYDPSYGLIYQPIQDPNTKTTIAGSALATMQNDAIAGFFQQVQRDGKPAIGITKPKQADGTKIKGGGFVNLGLSSNPF